MNVHLAIDLGAESGRVIAVWVDGGRSRYRELARFTHTAMTLPSGLHWNIQQIWSEILSGLSSAAAWAQRENAQVVSIGADTWGVDWVLLTARGELLGLPHAYRSPRNPQYYERALKLVSAATIYSTTGIQLMPINSLYSLYASSIEDPELISSAHRLLFMPDLIHYWLSGVMAIEQTIASTSQMLSCRTGTWASELLNQLGLRTSMLSEPVPAGTRLGSIATQVAEVTGLSREVQIITPGSHDTASAVAAVPSLEPNTCFLSSGTWSLLGCELDRYVVSEAARTANFTNELGVGGKIRFLKNIAGLWLVQECRRYWNADGDDSDYASLTEMAESAAPFRTLVNPDWAPFQSPGHMPEKIERFARETNQPTPKTKGEFVRCALESLALAYRRTVMTMEAIVDLNFDKIHIVGGGCKNHLLNQLTATCTQKTVVAGPAEATALGNGLVQAMTMGSLMDLAELRNVVRGGIHDLTSFEPEPPISPSVLERFEQLMIRS